MPADKKYDAMIRVRLPKDVRDRFAAEAAAKGMTTAEFLRDRIVDRDTKKYGPKN